MLSSASAAFTFRRSFYSHFFCCISVVDVSLVFSSRCQCLPNFVVVAVMSLSLSLSLSLSDWWKLDFRGSWFRPLSGSPLGAKLGRGDDRRVGFRILKWVSGSVEGERYSLRSLQDWLCFRSSWHQGSKRFQWESTQDSEMVWLRWRCHRGQVHCQETFLGPWGFCTMKGPLCR